jgi:hypothetical protein
MMRARPRATSFIASTSGLFWNLFSSMDMTEA